MYLKAGFSTSVGSVGAQYVLGLLPVCCRVNEFLGAHASLLVGGPGSWVCASQSGPGDHWGGSGIWVHRSCPGSGAGLESGFTGAWKLGLPSIWVNLTTRAVGVSL